MPAPPGPAKKPTKLPAIKRLAAAARTRDVPPMPDVENRPFWMLVVPLIV